MKRIALFLVCSLLVSSIHAQVIYNSSGKKGEAEYKKNAEKKGFDTHKLIFGGGLQAGFGNGTLILGLSPIVGYRVSDRFSAGLRLGYQYNWIQNGQYYMNGITGAIDGKNVNYHIVSPGVWARFIVWNNLFLYSEYEFNEFTYKAYKTSFAQPGFTSEQAWDHANSLLAGIGLRQPVSENASFVFIVFYDVLQNIPSNMRTDPSGNTYSISPYAGRVDFRIGFNVGF